MLLFNLQGLLQRPSLQFFRDGDADFPKTAALSLSFVVAYNHMQSTCGKFHFYVVVYRPTQPPILSGMAVSNSLMYSVLR